MIPKGCPFSDKLKLKLILHGRNGVCRGHQEKNDKEAYELNECCKGCRFFDQSVLSPWTFIPYTPPQPYTPSPWTTTAPNTTGGQTTTTITWTDYNSGNYTDNASNQLFYTPLSYTYSTLASGTSTTSAFLQPSVV